MHRRRHLDAVRIGRRERHPDAEGIAVRLRDPIGLRKSLGDGDNERDTLPLAERDGIRIPIGIGKPEPEPKGLELALTPVSRPPGLPT